MTKMNRQWLMAAALFCSCLPAGAEVYRWVDEQGQVHFGDQPENAPTHSFKSGKPAPAAANEQQRMEKTRKLLNAYQTERQQQREEREKQQKEIEERNRKCVDARDTLRQYRESGSIYSLDEEGKRNYLSDQDRDGLIRRYQEAIAKWCS